MRAGRNFVVGDPLADPAGCQLKSAAFEDGKPCQSKPQAARADPMSEGRQCRRFTRPCRGQQTHRGGGKAHRGAGTPPQRPQRPGGPILATVQPEGSRPLHAGGRAVGARRPGAGKA